MVEKMATSLKRIICEILDEETGMDIKEIDKIFISGEIIAIFDIENPDINLDNKKGSLEDEWDDSEWQQYLYV